MVTINTETGEVIKRFRSPYERVRTFTQIDGVSKTHQSHAESCDINRIISQFSRTGELPPAKRPPAYDDVSNLNRPMTELVEESRETGEKIATLKSDRKKQAAKKAAAEKKEFDDWKAKQQSLVPPETDASQT